MWSYNETDIDLLQFKYLKTSITRIINSKYLLPTIIGVFEGWGSGNSIRRIHDHIRHQIYHPEGTLTTIVIAGFNFHNINIGSQFLPFLSKMFFQKNA